jgi:hypothetical protein
MHEQMEGFRFRALAIFETPEFLEVGVGQIPYGFLRII